MIRRSDIILLPGSKSTLADLHELRRNGVAQAVIRAHREGATVMGICGGYQIMGQEVCDPDHVEGEIERLPGLAFTCQYTYDGREDYPANKIPPFRCCKGKQPFVY